MNIHMFTGLLFVAGAALASTSACTDQLEKYNSCLSAVDPNILKSHSLFDINKTCEILNGDDCIDFIKDVYTPSVNCSIKDENEKDSALSIVNLKIAYLKYCVTDDEGVICPLSEHLLESFSTNDNAKNNTEKKEEEDDGTFIVGEYNYLKTHAQEREFDDWNGAWKSFYPMITSGKLDDVFASLGDKGDTYKQMYTEGFKTDIVNLIFDKNDNNTITFKYDNGKEVKAEYKYSGYDILEWEKDVYGVFYKFERVDKKSKAPKYLRVCDEYLRTVEKNNVIFAWISDKSFEDAYDTKHWLGFAREEVPIKEIADVFIEEMGEEAKSEDETIEVTTDSIENPEIENDNSSEEESEDDNLVNKENFDLDNKEKQALFYEELINDCNIEKCNKRFLALEGLMKLIDPDSKETKAFEIAAEYYKSKNCKAIQGLVSDYITSGANSFLRRMSFTFVFMTIFTIVLLI